MDKRLLVTPNQSKERDVFFVNEDREFLKKVAAKSQYHPEIEKYIKDAKPLPGLIQVLITALGAYPFWPQNANGDIFEEAALKNKGKDWGYETFLSNANYFTHHVNKDPNLAKGKVLASVWNDKMKRVELVLGIDPVKDPDAATEIDAGRELAFSMGARLPYDVCSVCANQAKTRIQYCDHLKYFMSQMDPDSGKLVGALNPHPKFFDISRVIIPADKTAYMWTKIASAGSLSVADMHSKLGSALLAEMTAEQMFDVNFLQEKVASLREGLDKTSGLNKKAEIFKRIPTTTEMVIPPKENLKKIKKAIDANSCDIPVEKFASTHKLNEIISSMLHLGIVPKDSEIEKLASIYKEENVIIDPSFYCGDHIDQGLMLEFSKYIPERSFNRESLISRVSNLSLNKLASSTDKEKKESSSSKAAVMAALAAGLYALFSSSKDKSGSLSNPVSSFLNTATAADVRAGTPISNNALMALLAAGAIALMRKKDEPLTASGNFVATSPKSLYNNDWQRRFIDLQNRPVAVVKTAEAHSELKPVEEAFFGLPAMLMCAELDLIPENASWFRSGAFDENTTKLADDCLAGVNRFYSQKLSITSPEFLSMLSGKDKINIQDLALQGLINEKF